MSQSAAIEHVAPVAAPARVGQATTVEQSRAIAEVQAAIVVAQQCPRSVGVARTAMQESCQQPGLAERAFYRYPRSGQTVQGPSVHLARELARCWGNVQYGIAELRRDDEYGESEMQAWAWDVQTNARSSQTFIVPHKRDKRGGAERLTDLRDIYENNANMGARRLREAIFSILPPWFTEEAKELCSKTLEQGDGRPLADRVDGAVKAFESLGVTVDRLEQKLGRARDRWNGYDIAQLRITHRSIQRGEVGIDDEFPQPRVTVDEITQQAAAGSSGGGVSPEVSPSAAGAPAGSTPATAAPPPDTQPPAEGRPAPRLATKDQLKAINTLLASKCAAQGEARFLALADPDVLGRELESTKEITFDEAGPLIERLGAMPDYHPPADDGPGTEPFT